MPAFLTAQRVLILVAVACIFLAVGFLLFSFMVAIFVPSAVRFLVPDFDYLVGIPLIIGVGLLVLLGKVKPD